MYQDDLPGLLCGQHVDVLTRLHAIRITGLNEISIHTARRRYRVECLTCQEIVHDATTGPIWNVEHHLLEFTGESLSADFWKSLRANIVGTPGSV